MVEIKLTQEEITEVEQEQFAKLNKIREKNKDLPADNISSLTQQEYEGYEELVSYHLEKREDHKRSIYEPVYIKAFKEATRSHKTKRGWTAESVEDFSADHLQIYDDLVRSGLEKIDKKYKNVYY